MTELYPPESQKLDVIGHLEELRSRIWKCVLAVTAASLVLLVRADVLIKIVKKPLRGYADKLVFIDPTEAFTAYFKIVLLFGAMIAFPVILYQAWAFFSLALPPHQRKSTAKWLVFALFLFIAGVAFSYGLAVPFALRFLMGFGEQIAVPMLTLEKYVSFFTELIFTGGIIFEIPVILGLLTEIGLLRPEFLRQKRSAAYVIILIASAVITPTQDAFNMVLFAFPMVMLYEVGVALSHFVQTKKEGGAR